jgi:hypothetical protein
MKFLIMLLDLKQMNFQVIPMSKIGIVMGIAQNLPLLEEMKKNLTGIMVD